MKKYNKYKSSGVDWFDELPQNWKVVKFKYITKLMTCGHAATPEYVDESEGVPFISAQNIKNEGITFNPLKFIKPELHKTLTQNNQVEKGDILQARVGGTSNIGQTAIYDHDLDVSIYVSLSHIKLNSLAFNGYVKFLCNSQLYKDHAWSLMKKGGGVANFNVSDQEKIRIPLPPFEEQNKISQFLDHQTAIIDKLIQQKEKLIELLKEKRQAVINEAVTKGLNLKVKMKDSGIKWLGEVPAHWELKKLKHIVSINSSEEVSSETSFKVALENIESGTGKFIESNSENQFEGVGNFFKNGDVLFNKLRPYLAKVYLAQQEGYSVGELLVFTPSSEISSEFLFYRLLSPAFIEIVNGSTYGAKMPRASWNFIGNLPIPVPNEREQEDVVEFIETFYSRANTLIFQSAFQIEKLKEYRQSIISEAVTGKIDVRDWQPNKKPVA